jgi:TPR repeat protein
MGGGNHRLDCQRLSVLRDCHTKGDYGFMGTSTREEVIRLEDTDQVQATLPKMGALIALQLEGSLARGSTLDIGLVAVGQRRTTRPTAGLDDLEGDCGGATHFVKGVTVGALAVATGSRAQVSTVAQVFGAAANGKSESKESVSSKDGSLDACAHASPDAQLPPAQCGAPLRIELIKLGPTTTKATPDTAPGSEASPAQTAGAVRCAEGYASVDGKCTRGAAENSHECDPKNTKECTSQCAAGNARSCLYLGEAYESADTVRADLRGAAEYYGKACDGKDDWGCYFLGLLMHNGRGVPRNFAQAAEYFKRSCLNGVAPSCTMQGVDFFFGIEMPTDKARAISLFRTGCDGGDPEGCTRLGNAYLLGTGIPRDGQLAVPLLRRACIGNSSEGCKFLGNAYRMGVGVPQDAATATGFASKACSLNAASCGQLALMFAVGQGVPKNESRSRALFEAMNRATPDDPYTTAVLRVLFDEPVQIPAALEEKTIAGNWEACEVDGRLCVVFGIMQAAIGQTGPAIKNMKKSCAAGEPWGCYALAKTGISIR